MAPDRATRKARQILRDTCVQEPPVPVDEIAQQLGARIRYRPFEGELSGLIVLDGSDWVIGVNSLHAPVRQRFTIAHEIGHMVLHDFPEGDVHIDRTSPLRFRNPTSSKGTDQLEKEANKFAAELIMPRSLLILDLKREIGALEELDVEALIEKLALRYNVSPQAMTFRLTNLGIFG